MRAFVGTLLLLLLLGQIAFAQKWGKVTDEEWAFFQPGADAILLFKIGKFSITPDFEFSGEYHIRILILTEKGADKYGNVRIPFWHEDRIEDFKAHTILPNGKKKKVKKKAVREEKDGFYKYKVFTFPEVQPNTIIEYKFTEKSPYISVLPRFYFQEEIYSRMSRLELILPAGLNYGLLTRNFRHFSPELKEEPITNIYGGRARYKRFVLELRDIPGLKEEPFAPDIDNYRTAIYIQLRSYQDAYTFLQFANTWRTVAKRYAKSYYGFFDDNASITQTANAITANATTPKEKIQLLYRFVRDSIVTTKYKGTVGIRLNPPPKVLSTRQGSGEEKNLLLVALLKAIGIDAWPLGISTRSNGEILNDFPDVTMINRVLARAVVGRTIYLMDTRAKELPFGVLLPDYLVSRGLLIKPEKGGLVKVTPAKVDSKIRVESDATLTPEGTITLTSTLIYTGYNAILTRRGIHNNSLEKYYQKILGKRFDNVTLDTVWAEALETPGEPLVVHLQLTLSEYAPVMGDITPLVPPFLTAQQENPFKSKRRVLPIQFRFPFSETETLTLHLPENLPLSEIPESTSFKNPNLNYNLRIISNEGTVQFFRKFNLKKAFFYPRDYKTIQKFFTIVTDQDHQAVVLGMAETGDSQ